MQMGEGWLKTWICLSFLFAWAQAARPRFDVSTDMGLVLVPADAEVDSAIFRLRATDQDADFPLVFEIIATTAPIVRVENLPCTLYNKVCQANVILTRRLVAGRLHDFVVRVTDSRGDVNSMQATISVTNSTTPRDKIFPHIPSLIMVPEDTKPEKELDYLLVESNPWSGKPVYIELWQPKELFKIRQRQMGSQTKGIITLIGELDFETQSMYTLTMYATDPYTEPGKDTRNIAGLHVVVVVQDVQDVPPVFTLAPPLTKINNTVKPGDVILRVHAEDGDKGVPRQVTYGLISEGNPFTPFFNVSETTGEIILAKPLEELTKITHVGAPIVLKIVAEEIRSSRDEPPAQATVVELGLLLGEPGNSPPYFENDNYVAWLDENAEPGTIIMFTEAYSTRVKDEDIGKAGVFALKLENNNGTFEISPAVAERTANFVITVRDNALIDYEKFKSLRFKIVAQEVGPATNLSASVPVTIFLKDINDNLPIFDVPTYEVTISENANAGTRVVQVHATDNDAGFFGKIQYTRISGTGSEAFEMNPDTGLITVSMGSILDREQTAKLELTVEARDEDGRGQRGIAILIVNILDVNDNAPIFEKGIYEFLLNSDLNNFTMPAFIKAKDADAEPPNNVVRYEIIHGNYDNKFLLNEESGELILREAFPKARKTRQNDRAHLSSNRRKQFRASNIDIFSNSTNDNDTFDSIFNTTLNQTFDLTTISIINSTLDLNFNTTLDLPSNSTLNSTTDSGFRDFHLLNNLTHVDLDAKNQSRRRRAEDAPLFILTARAYDLGVPHLSNIAQVRIMRPMSPFARIVMFVMPGENPDPQKTAETLATITGSRVTIQEIKPYVQVDPGSSDIGKRSVVVAKVENGPGTLVDVDKIRASLAANGFGIISGMDGVTSDSPGSSVNPTNSANPTNPSSPSNPASPGTDGSTKSVSNIEKTTSKNVTVVGSSTEEVTVYKAENKLLTWLLVLLGLLILAALITLIICCICPSCPFYMEPRKRRIHSSETLVVRSDGRPKRHLHRKPIKVIDGYYTERKEAWSADPARQHWQFNRRNTKNLGIASLPGDVVTSHPHDAEMERLRRAGSLRLHDGTDPAVFGEQIQHVQHTRIIPMPMENERIFMEDMEAQARNYERAEMDSLKRHELERGSDGMLRNGAAGAARQEMVREQHFYRDGNAEVLRLVTRGEIEDHQQKDQYRPNGKDILLQRFIEDQKLRRNQDLRDSFHESLHEADVDRSMESHQRIDGPAEIIIIPERLEVQRQPSYNQRQQEQMMNADMQRVILERSYKDSEDERYRSREALRASMRDAELGPAGEAGSRSVNDNASGRDRRGDGAYGMHDAELVRQNALLTRLLLEREGRPGGLSVPMADSASFLETQSLPGQVAIATQTDRTAATQTEFWSRSRSDNEESEEDPRIKRKSKLKGRLETKEDFKKMKTIWVRTPIPEESRAQSGKKSTPTRTKIEVSESRKVSISPDVLQEISNSLKSGDSGENEGDEEEDEVYEDQAETKHFDKVQKARKVTSKTICTKKKVKETRVDDDSTTPSPDTKEKTTIMGKIRKQPEKPPRVKKVEKSTDSEKSHFMEPSFRILEREINSFQQKIREFGDKKFKMLKKDDSKKEKESEDEDGTTYDVSKKCELTVKKTKKSISRDTSPTKISVEQKTKTSEEECSSVKEKRVTKSKLQNVSSSEFEDFDQSKRPPKLCESAMQCETSKSLTSSRSKLKRQTNLESSETKSSCEKIEKCYESESKTDKSKDSTSSAELKIDTTSSSSIDCEKQQKQVENQKMQKTQMQDKKTLPSQRSVPKKPSRIVDFKKKISSLKSKSVEEPSKKILKKGEKVDKAKSLPSDDSKSTSPSKSRDSISYKKLTTSEEEKTSHTSKSSMSKESLAIDLDKLAQDVRGVVEKEISSLTQAAKDALNKSQSEHSVVDKKDEKMKMSKSIESHKVQPVTDRKSKGQTVDKPKIWRSSESKEKKENMRDQKDRSKAMEKSSSVKSDDAISFVVIENKKGVSCASEGSKKFDESIKDIKSIEKVAQVRTKDGKTISKEKLIKNENDTKALDGISKKKFEKTEETKTKISDKISETKDSLSKQASETKDAVSKRINEAKEKVIEKVDNVNRGVSKQIDETKKSISDKTNETKKSVTDAMKETKEKVENSTIKTEKSLSTKIDKIEKITSDTVDETKKFASDTIDEAKQVVSDKIEETDKIKETQINVKDKLDETAKTLSDKIDETQKHVKETFDTSKMIATDKINETIKSNVNNVIEIKENISDKINDTKETISNKIDETKSTISNDVDETSKAIVDTIDNTEKDVKDSLNKTKSNIIETVDDTKSNVKDKIDETKKGVADGVIKTKEMISAGVDSTKKMISDKISETKESISDIADDTKKNMSDKITKTEETVSNIINDTEKVASDKISQTKEIVSNKIDDSLKITSDKVSEATKTITEKTGDTIKMTSDKASEATKVVGDKIDDTVKTTSDKVSEATKTVAEKTGDTIKMTSDKVSEAAKEVADKIDDSTKITSDKVSEAAKVVADKIDDSTKISSDKVSEAAKVVADKIDDSTKITSDKVSEAAKVVADKIDDSTKMTSDKVSKAPKVVTDEINKTSADIKHTFDENKSEIGESIRNTKEDIHITDKEQKSKEKIVQLSSPTKTDDVATGLSNKEIDDKSYVKETASTNSKSHLLNLKSTSLPNKSKDENGREISRTYSEVDETQINNKTPSIIITNEVKELTKELLEIEKMNESKMYQGKKEADEKPMTYVTTYETTDKTETEDSDSNKDKEISSTEMTQTNQSEKSETHMKQQIDKKESTSISHSDKITSEVSTSKSMKDQTKTTKSASVTEQSKEKLLPTNDENKKKSPTTKESEKSEVPIKLPSRQTEQPSLKVTNAIGKDTEEISEDEDSSSASDISNKTALRTRPYRTPRHSVSSDGGAAVKDSAATPKTSEIPNGVKSDGKARQKWSLERDPLLRVEASKDSPGKAVFPQKIEVTPMDKSKMAGKAPIDQAKAAAEKSAAKESHDDFDETASMSSVSTGLTDMKGSDASDSKQRSRSRPVIVAMKRKEQHLRTDHYTRHTESSQRKASPRREKHDDKKSHQTHTEEHTSTSKSTSEQRRIEIRSKHMKLHVYRQAKDDDTTTASEREDRGGLKPTAVTRIPSPARDKDSDSQASSSRIIDYGKDPEIAKARSRYMAWYQQKRDEMEKKRKERKDAEEQQQSKGQKRTPAARKSRKAKSAGDNLEKQSEEASKSKERAKSSSDAAQNTVTTPRGTRIHKLRIRPLVNVESEQLKAIVRQGRKLRKAEGAREEDPPVQIFVPEKPPPPAVDALSTTLQIEPRHHLTQHSEYKYEKQVQTAPFYLHPPPPVPHSSPEHFQDDSSESRRPDDDLDSGIAVSLQGGATGRLRHQQLLEKKSVFDIAYSEAAPTQLRSDSSTPPS